MPSDGPCRIWAFDEVHRWTAEAQDGALKMLEEAAAMVRRAGYMIGNVDCSVICEAPKIAPHKANMQENLSKAVGAPVTVKGRRAEELGAIGRREGIACFAVTVIERS